MVAKLLLYHNARNSSGSLVTTKKSNNKEHFHSSDIMSLYTLVKTKLKKLKESCICFRCLTIYCFRITLIYATVAFIPQLCVSTKLLLLVAGNKMCGTGLSSNGTCPYQVS